MRVMAHYMQPFDGGEMIRQLEEGADPHALNTLAFGLCAALPPTEAERDEGKRAFYALVFGAGAALMGSIVGGNGKKAIAAFLRKRPAFAKFRAGVMKAASKYGFLKTFGGRKIFIRHQHASVNSLCQGGGAMVMKYAVVLLERACGATTSHMHPYPGDSGIVTVQHDEYQADVPEEIAGERAELQEKCIADAGEMLGLRMAMSGTSNQGGDWSATH